VSPNERYNEVTATIEQVASHDERSTRLTRAISRATAAFGSFPAILIALVLIAGWVAGGFFVTEGVANATYEFCLTAATSVVTFLMVFIIQSTQNRDSRAMQAKLDAANAALHALARRLDVDTPHLLELAGLEDAPEPVIREHQLEVRTTVYDQVTHETDGGAPCPVQGQP
jgi:low affinity Fe/Cu permease